MNRDHEAIRPEDIPEDIWQTAGVVANAVGAGLAIGSRETIARALLAERLGRGRTVRSAESAKDAPRYGPPSWHGATTQRDWLLNGSPIRTPHQREVWGKLDWWRAWIDMGPSPTSNPGPYWHVPWDCEGEELWARLYPKLLLTKWLPVVQRVAIAIKPGDPVVNGSP